MGVSLLNLKSVAAVLISAKKLHLLFSSQKIITCSLNQEFQLLCISVDFLKHPVLPRQFLHSNMLFDMTIYSKLKTLGERERILMGITDMGF